MASDKISCPSQKQIYQVHANQFPCQHMAVLRHVGPTTLTEWAKGYLIPSFGLADWMRVIT